MISTQASECKVRVTRGDASAAALDGAALWLHERLVEAGDRLLGRAPAGGVRSGLHEVDLEPADWPGVSVTRA
jgi:hypothetical protein